MAKKTNNKSAIRTEKDRKVPAYNRAVYSVFNPLYGYPNVGQAALGALEAHHKTVHDNQDKMNYLVEDSVADAGWRKRVGLSYDNKWLIDNKDGSVKLPKNVESRIPVDTTALKKDIAYLEDLLYSDTPRSLGQEKFNLLKGFLDIDKNNLEALRKTYKTGKPVVLNSGSYKGRKLINDENEFVDRWSPLNILENYTVQYNPKTNTMDYRDTYDFNGFESFVPGKPFEIKGSIPLQKYDIGGWLSNIGSKLDSLNSSTTDKFLNSGIGKGLSSFGIKSGNIGGIANTAATAISGLLAGQNKSGVGTALQGIGSLASNIPGVGGLVGAGVNLVGGLVNAAFGSNLNKENIAQVEGDISKALNFTSNAGDYDALSSNYSNLQGVMGFDKDFIGSDGWFSSKAEKKFNSLTKQAEEAEQQQLNALFQNKQNIAKTNQQLMEANYNAYGGPIDMKYTGVMSPFGNRFKNGGIFIKPSKRGTFTAAAKKRGMSVQEFASKVLANKEDYSPAMVKKANFARNASKWKHADGGQLFTNGVTMVGNGGTHEQNPMEGVLMGIDPNGIPNLVEEGEVIFNDYVFSNRLNVPSAVRKKYKLRGNKELTFADAAKQMQKESEERPNDSISKRGLEDAMLRLQQAQETVREEKQASQEGREYAHGGKMGILFDGLGEIPQRMPRAKAKRQGYDVGSSLEDYLEDSVYENAGDSKSNLSWLRYAPVVGAAIGLGQNLLSKPDYSSPNAVLAAAERAGTYTPVRFSPVGNYLTYTPFDRDYYINKLNVDTAASRRGIVNTSGGNRAAAMAGILASDYNYGNQLGALARQAEEYNLAQRQAVETFNRATDMANAEMGLKAAIANQEAALNAGRTRLSGTAQAMAMRDEIAARRGASMSANLTNLFDSLGNIGIDEMNRADRDMLIRAGVFGTLSEKPQGWSNKRWEDYKKTISGKGYSRGGQLKKKRGGFTY